VSPLATYIVQTAVTLVAVGALALVVLYGARKAGLGRSHGPLELLGKLPLDGRRAIYLVRVAGRTYVLGASEGSMVKLGELEAEAAASEEP
jgi:flagellar biogenesis protein FliO